MSPDHDEVRMLLGAYVLGGLDAADRRRVDEHLPTCADCRDEVARSAALPGLLRRRPDASRPPGDAPEVPSAALLPALLDEVRSRRRSRRRRLVVRSLVVAAAAVIAVLAAGLTFLRDGDEAPGSVVAFTAAAGIPARGEIVLTAKPWGTAMTLRVADLPAEGPFTLEVTGSDGVRQRAAAWGVTPNRRAEVAGATSLTPRDITAVRVVGPRGMVLTATPNP